LKADARPGCAPSARLENQTNKSRGGRSRVEGTKDVMAASTLACREEAVDGTWKSGSRDGGAALPTQQLAQAGHFAWDAADALDADWRQWSPPLREAIW
jgi:hypothetical protein